MQKTKFKETEIGMIPEKWKTAILADHIKIIGGGTPKTAIDEYWNGSIPWISVVDFVGDRRWIHDTEKHITPKGLENSSTKLLHKGQIIISARGTVGELGQVTKDMAFNQSCYGLDGKEDLNNDYLYYLLKNKIKEFQQKGHGAVFNTITTDTFSQIIIPLLDINEQSKIAKILTDLDSKIELNQNMNKTLETIGQAIFKHWFVDFEFPDEYGRPYKSSGGKMIDSELGEIPKGWKIGKLNDVAEVIGGGTPRTNIKEYFCEKGIAWLTPKDLSGFTGKFIQHGATDITEDGLKNSSAKLMPKGTILFSSRAPIGYCAISENEISTNQGFKSLIPKQGICSEFLYQFLIHNLELIKSRAHGSTFGEVPGSVMKNIEILIPPMDLLKDYGKIVESLNQKIQSMQHQNRYLTDIRDSTLPRLISGKIRVPVEVS